MTYLFINLFSKKYNDDDENETPKKKMSVNSINSVNGEQDNENLRNTARTLLKSNKQVFRLLKNKEIHVNDEVYSSFRDALKTYDTRIKTILNTKSIFLKEIIYSVLKLLGFTMVLYLKNPQDLGDTIYDLQELLQKLESTENKQRKKSISSSTSKDCIVDNEIYEVLTEICLQLISLGNQSLMENVMKIFKRISKYLGKESIDILKEYLENN